MPAAGVLGRRQRSYIELCSPQGGGTDLVVLEVVQSSLIEGVVTRVAVILISSGCPKRVNHGSEAAGVGVAGEGDEEPGVADDCAAGSRAPGHGVGGEDGKPAGKKRVCEIGWFIARDCAAGGHAAAGEGVEGTCEDDAGE